MNKKLEEVVAKIMKTDLLIRSGSSFRWEEEISSDTLELACYCAMHCIYNGPVGVCKVTNWPGKSGSFSVKQLISTISNSKWKHFCGLIEKLITIDFDPAMKDCYTILSFGSTWPSCDGIFKPKKKVE
jgi:hypothetical protein